MLLAQAGSPKGGEAPHPFLVGLVEFGDSIVRQVQARRVFHQFFALESQESLDLDLELLFLLFPVVFFPLGHLEDPFLAGAKLPAPEHPFDVRNPHRLDDRMEQLALLLHQVLLKPHFRIEGIE